MRAQALCAAPTTGPARQRDREQSQGAAARGPPCPCTTPCDGADKSDAQRRDSRVGHVREQVLAAAFGASHPETLRDVMSGPVNNVGIPDAMYRRLQSRAAREGSATRALILKGVKEVLKVDREKAGAPVSLPIVPSKRPVTVALDNAAIHDIAFL